METVTNEQVLGVYLKRREKIAELRKEIQLHEEKQVAAEKWLIANGPTVEAVAEIYIARRNEAAALEKCVKEIKARQDEVFEKWFAQRMREVGTDAFKTAAGTIYSYRGESVTVGDWDTFVEASLLKPAAEQIVHALRPADADLADDAAMALEVQAFVAMLKETLPLYLLNHAVAKNAVLEIMGDLDEKTKSRPKPPPMGVNYSAVVKVGVRKS